MRDLGFVKQCGHLTTWVLFTSLSWENGTKILQQSDRGMSLGFQGMLSRKADSSNSVESPGKQGFKMKILTYDLTRMASFLNPVLLIELRGLWRRLIKEAKKSLDQPVLQMKLMNNKVGIPWRRSSTRVKRKKVKIPAPKMKNSRIAWKK